MDTWTVELEPGVWIAPWEGDPGRTVLPVHAKKFISRAAALRALADAVEYRLFARAKILRSEEPCSADSRNGG